MMSRSAVPVDPDCSMSDPRRTMDAAKNEATRTADRANGRHMARVSPPTSSEERKRLMSIVSPTPDPSSTCVDIHPDGCPNCVVNVEEPYLHEVTADTCIAMYLCRDCNHEWTTSWGGR